MAVASITVAVGVLVLGVYLWVHVKAFHAPIAVLCLGLWSWGAVIAAFGHARPVTHDVMGEFKDMTILAYSMREGEAIYLWVDGPEPMAYRLPWSLKEAKKLHSAGEKAKKGKSPLKAYRRNDGEWVFHHEPPRPLPPKGQNR